MAAGVRPGRAVRRRPRATATRAGGAHGGDDDEQHVLRRDPDELGEHDREQEPDVDERVVDAGEAGDPLRVGQRLRLHQPGEDADPVRGPQQRRRDQGERPRSRGARRAASRSVATVASAEPDDRLPAADQPRQARHEGLDAGAAGQRDDGGQRGVRDRGSRRWRRPRAPGRRRRRAPAPRRPRAPSARPRARSAGGSRAGRCSSSRSGRGGYAPRAAGLRAPQQRDGGDEGEQHLHAVREQRRGRTPLGQRAGHGGAEPEAEGQRQRGPAGPDARHGRGRQLLDPGRARHHRRRDAHAADEPAGAQRDRARAAQGRGPRCRATPSARAATTSGRRPTRSDDGPVSRNPGTSPRT